MMTVHVPDLFRAITHWKREGLSVLAQKVSIVLSPRLAAACPVATPAMVVQGAVAGLAL